MFQECAFHVDILDQIRAPAKRAVEKFPVSPFHLENGDIQYSCR